MYNVEVDLLKYFGEKMDLMYKILALVEGVEISNGVFCVEWDDTKGVRHQEVGASIESAMSNALKIIDCS